MSNEGNFELGVSGWYEVQTSVPNDFLNEKLDSEDYGLWYSVKFVGDADTYLWQTKTPPTPSEKYWGQPQTTKSGKSTKFKWDKKNAPSHTPDGKPTPQTEKGDAITKSMVVKLAFQGFISAEGMLPQKEEHWALVEYTSDMLYKTIHGIKELDPVIEDVPDKITLEDLED